MKCVFKMCHKNPQAVPRSILGCRNEKGVQIFETNIAGINQIKKKQSQKWIQVALFFLNFLFVLICLFMQELGSLESIVV